MCPAEIKGRLKAFTEARKQALKAQDTLAWMIGWYGHTAPKKYPKKPVIVKEQAPAMTADQMKDAFRAFKTKQEAENGNNP